MQNTVENNQKWYVFPSSIKSWKQT